MASLKEIRTRINSVANTRQVTSAMKLVSAAKLRKAQIATERMRPYAEKLNEILHHLSDSLDAAEDNIYALERKEERVLLIVVSSNRGLCGAFNSNVAKQAMELADTVYFRHKKKGKLDFVSIGKKAGDLLKMRGYNLVTRHDDLWDDLNFEKALQIAEQYMKDFRNKKYDRVQIIYNHFLNAAVQEVVNQQYLPIKVEEHEKDKYYSDYIFEPSKKEIIQDLIPRTLKIQFYKALLESNTSEHGARMTAMHKATDNATDLIRELRLTYNKERQNAITSEILDIVGGAEALRG